MSALQTCAATGCAEPLDREGARLCSSHDSETPSHISPQMLKHFLVSHAGEEPQTEVSAVVGARDDAGADSRRRAAGHE